MVFVLSFRNTSIEVEDEASSGIPLHGKLNGIATPSTIDILFQLGITQDEGTPAR